eukprot:TRINITY_DN49144_c0_g1_i1.p1 TRINITY_DN49144_c0_g1~~TRINITY_DN49144_c0_g1_i1.p1  ORF type:complete len:600 (-),score=41.66 TRINITY_DN49144_c0_g1_i1:206-2005(-)
MTSSLASRCSGGSVASSSSSRQLYYASRVSRCIGFHSLSRTLNYFSVTQSASVVKVDALSPLSRAAMTTTRQAKDEKSEVAEDSRQSRKALTPIDLVVSLSPSHKTQPLQFASSVSSSSNMVMTAEELTRNGKKPFCRLHYLALLCSFWLVILLLFHGWWVHRLNSTQLTFSDHSQCHLNPKHLVFMSHGWTGVPSNMDVLLEEIQNHIRETNPSACVLFHKAHANWGAFRSFFTTSDGVDIGGQRIVEEIREIIANNPSLEELTFVAHSLGGLYCRYAAGILSQEGRPVKLSRMSAKPQKMPIEKNETELIAGLKPINYVSLGSPHVGIRGNFPSIIEKVGALLFLSPQRESRAVGSIRRFFRIDPNYGRTFQQLTLRDNAEMMLRLSEPDGPFLNGLSKFHQRHLYANAVRDFFVPCGSAALVHACPLWNKPLIHRPRNDDQDSCSTGGEKGASVPSSQSTSPDDAATTSTTQTDSTSPSTPYPHIIAAYETLRPNQTTPIPALPPVPPLHYFPAYAIERVKRDGFGQGFYPSESVEADMVTNLRSVGWMHTIVHYRKPLTLLFSHQLLIFAFKHWAYIIHGTHHEIPRHVADSLSL